MNYDLNWLLNQDQEKQKWLFFWGHRPSYDGSITQSCMSQWWEGHPFEEDGVVYPTAEHYMMAGKARLFKDLEIWEEIIRSETPKEAKALGRKVRNFDQLVWEAHRCEIVIKGNQLKFSQHAELNAYLVNTGKRVLVEASPLDQVWGIGLAKDHRDATDPSKWKGLNLLGFCLMEVRDLLIA